jgi:hypothetical protein
MSALTPAAAGFVGTIQRRLSTANSSISEGKISPFSRRRLCSFQNRFLFSLFFGEKARPFLK